MRRFYYLVIIFLPGVVTAFGQNAITYESNAYLSGDQQQYFLVENYRDLFEGSPGYNVTWDYSYLIPGDSLTGFMLDATQQKNSEHFPEANIAIKENEKVVFVNVSAEGMEEYGFAQENSVYKFDQPIRRFSFPFVFGSTINGSYTSEKLGFPETKSTGVYDSEIDGYGTLILPGNIVIKNVLRVKTSRLNEKTRVKYVVYRWYLQDRDPVLRYPLLSIIIRESPGNICVSKAAYYADADQLVEQAPAKLELVSMQEFSTPEALIMNIKVYPNPFIEKAIVNYMLPKDGKVTIIVADALGRVVDTLIDKEQNAGEHSLEFKGKGYYFLYYFITMVDGKVVSSKKIYHVNR